MYIQWLTVIASTTCPRKRRGKDNGAKNTRKIYFILYHPAGAPVVTRDIAEVQTTPGQDINICCEALGQEPLYFQWFKERNELQGQTRNMLTLQNVSQDDRGSYVCRVANSFGIVFTSWAKVIVNCPYGYNQQFGK